MTRVRFVLMGNRTVLEGLGTIEENLDSLDPQSQSAVKVIPESLSAKKDGFPLDLDHEDREWLVKTGLMGGEPSGIGSMYLMCFPSELEEIHQPPENQPSLFEVAP